MADAEELLARQARLGFGQKGEWVQMAATDRTAGTLYGDCAIKVIDEQPATAEVGVTFADNTAARDGSSIYNLVYDARTTRTAQATLRDSIVADASSQTDLVSNKPSMTLDLQPNLGSATALAGDFDLVRTYVARDAGTVTGTPLTADPLLGALGDNGGPTRTMAPSEGSPVVDAGAAFGLIADQRGLSRPFDFSAIPNAGDGSDIGAVELRPGPPGQPGGGGGPGSTTPAFGADTLVTLTLAAKRIPARGPLKIRVANANGFEITGRLSGQTVNRISAARKRRIKLRAKRFKVAASARATVRLALPKPVRRVLKRTGRVRLRLTAKVTDPAGNTRTVKKRVTPKLKRKRKR